MATMMEEVNPTMNDLITAAALSKPSIKCTGCSKEFPSKNQLFRHLTNNAKTCLTPEEYGEYMIHVVSAKKNWEKIGVLYGYLPGTDYRLSSKSPADDIAPSGVEGGNHAAWMVIQAIDRVSRIISGSGEDKKVAWSAEEAAIASKINRSYGSNSRGSEAIEQDEFTGAITEVLCTHAMPLYSKESSIGDGGEGISHNGERGNQMKDEDDPEQQKQVQEWVESVNQELEQMTSEMDVHRTSTKSPHSTGWSVGRVRVFGRVAISNKKFNAEMDVVHRRVDYCFPADLLYVSDKENRQNDQMPTSETGVQLKVQTLQDYFDSLPCFPPGNKPFRVVEQFDQNVGAANETLQSNPHAASYYNLEKPSPSNTRTLRPSIPRPNETTLTYLYALKKLMQRFATKVEELNVKDEAAVMEKEFHEKKRKKRREPKKKRSRKGESNSNDDKHDDFISVGKKDKECLPHGRKVDSPAKAFEPKGKRVLRRKRFHNFCPNILAHDFLAYRRMDRIYHRGTIRLQHENNDSESISAKQVTKNDRPFVVFSLTGDLFLREQALRVMGLLIAICRGAIDSDIIDCLFDEEYTNLVPAPLAPRLGLLSGEATYMTWEGRLKTILSARLCNIYKKGWNRKEIVNAVEKWEYSLLKDIARGWYWDGVTDDGRLLSEIDWLQNVLHPWAQKTRPLLEDYRRWKASKERNESTIEKETDDQSLLPPLESISHDVPEIFAKVLDLLRKADASGLWPSTSPKRSLVMVTTNSEESNVKSIAVAQSATRTKETRTSAYAYKEGEGGASGSFSVGAMPDLGCNQPKGNILFPELVKAAFELERALKPDREPSSTIAINRNAQFRPHTDNGAGAGQSNSLIVGLGNYVGGELVVEGAKKDIRYNAVEFDGWKERHWTMPFQGERYSLVWFTPKGCEGMRGIDMEFGEATTTD
mmetsp:Transcript_15656/g.32922  ORF Transcript_15656/g.32922 Transcript_15656/m.32922 type:complete len:930 (+) Transcript_15656:28-2817(+)